MDVDSSSPHSCRSVESPLACRLPKIASRLAVMTQALLGQGSATTQQEATRNRREGLHTVQGSLPMLSDLTERHMAQAQGASQLKPATKQAAAAAMEDMLEAVDMLPGRRVLRIPTACLEVQGRMPGAARGELRGVPLEAPGHMAEVLGVATGGHRRPGPACSELSLVRQTCGSTRRCRWPRRR
jgi:hypothetical protein